MALAKKVEDEFLNQSSPERKRTNNQGDYSNSDSGDSEGDNDEDF
jgi:hypothetical protein